jgi:YD repeat-containing protein
VTKNGIEQARFSYDPLGRRVEKVAGGLTTGYTCDREDILREVRGGATLRYVHGPGVDEPLAVDDGTALAYFHADALGSITKVTNVAGAATPHVVRCMGNLGAGASEQLCVYRREWEPIGLYCYGAKY